MLSNKVVNYFKNKEKNKSDTNKYLKSVAPVPPKDKEKELGIGDRVMSHGIQIFDPRLGERDERLTIKNIIKSFKNFKLK
jgi:hypothetical protein